MNTPMTYRLSSDDEHKQLIEKLADSYAIKADRSILCLAALYDTFDWRLFNKSLVLYTMGESIHLRRLYENDVIHSAEYISPPAFLNTLQDGELKAVLRPIIKMRALLKLVEMHYRSTSHRILNSDVKTVARIRYDEFRSSPAKDSHLISAQLWLLPVKGYPSYYRGLTRRIKTAGLAPRRRNDLYFEALEFAGKTPGSYSSKLRLRLEPEMKSDEATRTILRDLLQTMKTNESFIEKDLDTEFLHDYRVAIRRTRSALSQIKNVFPKETTARFKKDFSYLGKLSNDLRDLDVYLLEEDTYRSKLPTALQEGLPPLFSYLRKKRTEALKQFIAQHAAHCLRLPQGVDSRVDMAMQSEVLAVGAAFDRV